MILCNLKYLFDPNEITYTVTDVLRPKSICTDGNSRIGFNNSDQKYVLHLTNLQEVIKLASTNPDIIFMIELGFPVYTWLEDFDNIQNLCKTINPYPNIHLLFVNGWDLYSDILYTEDDKVIHQGVYEYTRVLTIPHNRLHFWICNVGVLEKVKKYFARSDVEYYNIYFNRILKCRKESGFSNYVPTNKKREKYFLCLNNYEKTHRTNMVSFIKNYHEDKFTYSYLQPGEKNIHLKKILDTEHNMKTIEVWQDSILPELIDSAYLYVATETFYLNKWIVYNYEGPEESVHQYHDGWISEKTFKSAYNMQPMIIVGPAGSLATFKSLGFKSFPEFFNETYDSIPDYQKRLKAIKDNINKITAMSIDDVHTLYHSDSVQEKLQHNRELFEQYAQSDPFKQFYHR